MATWWCSKGDKEMNYVWYMFGGMLFISAVGLLSKTNDNLSIIVGAVMLLLSVFSCYIGGQEDE